MASNRDETRLAALDLGLQTAERVALDKLCLESVERFGLDAATLERRLRLFGQVSEHLGHRPAGMHGDGRIVDCEERERSVGRGDHACRPRGAHSSIGAIDAADDAVEHRRVGAGLHESASVGERGSDVERRKHAYRPRVGPVDDE